MNKPYSVPAATFQLLQLVDKIGSELENIPLRVMTKAEKKITEALVSARVGEYRVDEDKDTRFYMKRIPVK